MLLYFIVIWVGENATDEKRFWKRFSRYTTIGLFSAFFFTYTGVLVVLIRRLKKYFKKFYYHERFKIITAAGSIIIAILCRVGTNLWYIYNEDPLDESYDNNTWLFPAYQLITGLSASLFPLAAIIISILYALYQRERV